MTHTATRTVVITGATRGLGLHAAEALAASPGWEVVLAVRDATAGRALADRIGAAGVVELDLADLGSIRRATETLAERHAPLDALVLNAGMQVTRADRETRDGFELTFGVNHLGNFAFGTRLMDGALAPGARVVVVSSGTHFGSVRKAGPYPGPRWRDPRDLARADGGSGQVAYATSKLANVFFAYEAARRLEGRATVNAYDPGLMPSTGLARDYPPRLQRLYGAMAPLLKRWVPGASSPEASGRQLARLVTDPALEGVTGRYFEIGREAPSSALSHDRARAAELWEVSAELTGAGAVLEPVRA
jgi:protochlorophyllide reductase